MKLDFVKGHMGGNTIVLLHGSQLPEGQELEISLQILSSEYLCAHEAGILYQPMKGGDLQVKVVGYASRAFITACGGLSQVLGKVLVETPLGSHYGLNLSAPEIRVVLEMDCGPITLDIHVAEGRVKRVLTNMNPFVEELFADGIETLDLLGVRVMKVGKFLVVNGDQVRKVFPQTDFEAMNEETKRILIDLQSAFLSKFSPKSLDYALYDWHPHGSGQMRAVFPHRIPTGNIEPSCGTGTVAIGIAAFVNGELLDKGLLRDDRATLQIETGGGPTLGGNELTELELVLENNRVVGASFHHSLIEITATGSVCL